MAWSETPIFAGKTVNQQSTIASASATTATILSSNATYGQVVSDIVIYEKGSGGARTLRLELKNGSTTTVLKRFATSGTQYTSTNILRKATLSWLPDSDPVLRLGPGDSLQLTSEDTNANALDISVFAGSYEYPN